MSDLLSRLRRALEGRYTVERELGAGGMATVYLARDLKHNRKVALKVLKPELAAVVGAERFLAEIETTANLQHPDILPLYDSGEADSFLYYVMPYVEGESLRDRLDTERQLPVDEAVRIATAVANALDFAHQHGVVHRDIKPGNILFQGGQPVVGDFGIALALGAGGGARLTETGLSVGTPYYMSPEQATGDQVVGPRSDIYSLGCVLYEMLVGDPPYLGSTAQAVLGQIIAGKPAAATEKRTAVPANVDAAIRKALEKIPADRFATAAEMAAALADPAFRHGADAAGAGAVDARRWKVIALAASVVALLVVGVALAGRLGTPATEPEVRHQEIRISSLPMAEPWGRLMALASDGGMVYLDRVDEGQPPQLFYKARDETRGTPLPGTQDVTAVVFSPDGQRIAFVQNGNLVTRPVRGGAARTLTSGVDLNVPGLDWLSDGTILFETEEETLLVRIADDASAVPDTLASYGGLWWAQGIEGYDAALVVQGCPQCQLDILDLASDTVVRTIPDVRRAWYLADLGHLVYVRGDGAVFAIPYDPATDEMGEVGIPLFDGVRTGPQWADMVVGDDGTMVYVEGPPSQSGGWQLVWVDREGNAEPVDPKAAPADLVGLALSPDGRRIAVESRSEETRAVGISVYRLPNGPSTPVTTGTSQNLDPTWTADGRYVVFARQSDDNGGAVVRTRADGSTPTLDTLAASEEQRLRIPRFVPGDSALVITVAGSGPPDLARLDLANDTVSPLFRTEFAEFGGTVSPDGRWLAYVSDRTGTQDVFVRPFPNVLAGLTQISDGGGGSPVWSRDGKELFYVREDGVLVAAAIRADPAFTVEGTTELFSFDVDEYRVDWDGATLDVDVGGERFLAIRRYDVGQGAEGSDGTMIMVLDWFDELRSQLGGGS